MEELPNLDAWPGADAQKGWDIFPTPGVPLKDYLLFIFKRGNESEEETLTRVANFPSSQRNAPPEVEALLGPYRTKEYT